MIITVTPNPAVDRTVTVDELVIGSVHGGAVAIEAAGGKGLNVARTIRSLGGEAIAMGPVGGISGEAIRALAEAEGLQVALTPIGESSRTCTILTNQSGQSTVVNEAGPTVSAGEWVNVFEDIHSAAASARVVTISGSWPIGSQPGLLRSLAGGCPQGDAHVWIDCGPQWIGEAMSTGRSLKVNHHEAAAGLGRSAPDIDRAPWAIDAACELMGRGSYQCIITLGSEGAVWVSPEATLAVPAPTVPVVNTVGSGDAFLGALALAVAAGETQTRALALSLAAGAVNAMEPTAGTLDRKAVSDLAADVESDA